MAIGFDRGAARPPANGEEKEVDNLHETEDRGGHGLGGMKLIAVITTVVVILVMAIILIIAGSKGKGGSADATTEESEGGEAAVDENGNVVSGVQQQATTENGVYDALGNVVDQNAVNPGIPDYQNSEFNSTTATVFKDSDYIKDLNGLDILAIYNVESREYVNDYVSYEARRAIMDDGMELYWLEAEYKGKRYRVQCPYVYFKDLGPTGICKVEVEVLNIAGGGKVISYMQVVPEDKQ